MSCSTYIEDFGAYATIFVCGRVLQKKGIETTTCQNLQQNINTYHAHRLNVKLCL